MKPIHSILNSIVEPIEKVKKDYDNTNSREMIHIRLLNLWIVYNTKLMLLNAMRMGGGVYYTSDER